MNKKVDRSALMRKSLDAEKQTSLDRFKVAEGVIAGAAKTSPRDQSARATLRPTDSFSAESVDDRIRVEAIAKVHDNIYNARAIYHLEVIKERAASIAADGQKTPVPVIPHPDLPGEFMLIDGGYRKRALQYLGRDTIRLVVEEDKGKLELYRMSWLLNEQRNAQSALDNALAWTKLKKDGLVADDTRVAELLGISIGTVSKTMALLKLPPSVLERIKEAPQKFGVFMGYSLFQCSSLMDESALEQLVNDVIDKDLSTRDVENIRLGLVDKKPRKAKEVSRQYKVRAGSAQIGYLKEWDSGKVAFEVTLLDQKQRTALLEELKQRFSIES